jgi:hypothetical protein
MPKKWPVAPHPHEVLQIWEKMSCKQLEELQLASLKEIQFIKFQREVKQFHWMAISLKYELMSSV